MEKKGRIRSDHKQIHFRSKQIKQKIIEANPPPFMEPPDLRRRRTGGTGEAPARRLRR
jgi:hypothetical protein